MRRAVAVLSIAGLMLGGCAGATVLPARITHIDLGTPSATAPGASQPSLADAAALYQSLADTTNPKLDAATRAINAANSLSKLKAGIAQLASVEKTFEEGLLKGPWPASIQAKVDGAVTATSKIVTLTSVASEEKTEADITADSESLPSLEGDQKAALDLLRGALGLPIQ